MRSNWTPIIATTRQLAPATTGRVSTARDEARGVNEGSLVLFLGFIGKSPTESYSLFSNVVKALC